MSENIRPKGYYWVIWNGSVGIALWGPQLSHHPVENPSYTWTNECGPDYDAIDPEEVQVLLGPLHLHCYNRNCLRGSGAMDRYTQEHHPETFDATGCECACASCEAGRVASKLAP